MKYTYQKLAMASMLVVAGMAQAEVVTVASGGSVVVSGAGGPTGVSLVSGGGTLEFSNGTGVIGGVPTRSVGGLVGALNVGQVRMTGVDNALVTESITKVGRSNARSSVSIGANVTGLAFDNQTGVVSSVSSFGGAQQDAVYLDGILDGGRMTVKNLRFDLAHSTVYADMYGQAMNEDGSLAPVVSNLNTPLWTISSISGPITLAPATLAAARDGNFAPLINQGYQVVDASKGIFSTTNVLGGLKVTSAGFDIFAQSLGLTQGSTGYTTLQGVNGQVDGWGSVTSIMTLKVSAVPEPSSYAMVAMGMIVVGAAMRRRQQA